MPDAILKVCGQSQSDSSKQSSQMRADVNEFARRGFRSLAVAIAEGDAAFQLIGLLPIFDPPREDTAETIKKAIDLGIYSSIEIGLDHCLTHAYHVLSFIVQVSKWKWSPVISWKLPKKQDVA